MIWNDGVNYALNVSGYSMFGGVQINDVCTGKIQKFTTKIQKPTTKIQVIWIVRDCSIRLYYERLLLRTFLSFRMYPRKPTPPENYFLSGS